MWQRTEGGYEVMDRRMVEVAVDFSEKMERDAATCQTTGGSGRLSPVLRQVLGTLGVGWADVEASWLHLLGGVGCDLDDEVGV